METLTTPALLTTVETAAALRVSKRTTFRLVDRGTLRAVRVVGTLRFRADDVARLLKPADDAGPPASVVDPEPVAAPEPAGTAPAERPAGAPKPRRFDDCEGEAPQRNQRAARRSCARPRRRAARRGRPPRRARRRARAAQGTRRGRRLPRLRGGGRLRRRAVARRAGGGGRARGRGGGARADQAGERCDRARPSPCGGAGGRRRRGRVLRRVSRRDRRAADDGDSVDRVRVDVRGRS
jgi:excisionase family DNA binding protein